jgi:hypothetical protein
MKKTSFEYEVGGWCSQSYVTVEPHGKTKRISYECWFYLSLEWVASLWPLTTVAGAESLYICMKKTSYEYEVGWGSQSYVTVEPHGKTKRISDECWFYLSLEWVASLWPLATVAGAESLYICMKKISHEYEVGWGSQSYVTVEPHGKTKRISTSAGFTSPTSRYQAEVASIWPLATVTGAESLYTCMKKTSFEYEVGGWCSQSYLAVDPMAKPRESPTSAGFTSPTSRYQVGVASLWPLAGVEGAETLYTLYMHEGDLL